MFYQTLKILDYAWRLFATLLGFIVFGLGGFILNITLFKIIAYFYKNKLEGCKQVRIVIKIVFKIYLNFLQFLGVLVIKTTDIDSLKDLKSTIIICNHPSLLDVVVIMAYLDNVQCVVKNELWTNSLLGGVMVAAGFIRNDIGAEKFLAICKQQLTAGENIIIFPEGTRTVPGQTIKLRRGLGNLAIGAATNIQSLIINCEPPTLAKGESWYKIPKQRVQIHLSKGDFFPIKNYQNDNPRSIQVRCLTRDIQQYYNRILCYA